MGGRGGSSFSGSRAPNGYRTVGNKNGIKVIQDKKSGKGLPIQGPINGAFFRKGRDGKIDQYREYNQQGLPLKDIDKGHNHGQGDPHVHDWNGMQRGHGRPPYSNELEIIK